MASLLQDPALEPSAAFPSAARHRAFLRWAIPFKARSFTDPHLPTVLTGWALCWLLLGLLVYRYGLPLPWWNEWHLLVPVATGQEPVSLDWALRLKGEHPAPLTQLVVLGLGELTAWNTRVIHFANLTFLALAALALILAVRRARGRSTWSDLFLALVMLSPWQYETVLWACTGPALPLALFGLAVSALVTGWPLRSVLHLWPYLGLVLAVSLSAGPAANLWTAGLCGVAVRGWFGRRPRSWYVSSLLGTTTVLTISVAVNGSPWTALVGAALPIAAGWLGPALTSLGPWALLALALPGVYLLGRLLRDLGTGEGTPADEAAGLGAWIDLLLPLGAALGVALAAGAGRYGPGSPGDAHFASLLAPVGLMLYVLMVRLRAPQVIPTALAFLMAVGVGWSWKIGLAWARAAHDQIAGPVAALRNGGEPLSIWVADHAKVVGFSDPKPLLEYLLPMRAARRFVFRKEAPEPVRGMGPPLVRSAASARLRGGLQVVKDAQATGDAAALAGAGTAAFDVEVPAAGTYHLCGRLHVPDAASAVAVQVDDGPAVDSPLRPAPGYNPYMLPPVRLTAGKHVITLKAAGSGLRLDLLEIIPAARW